MKVAVFGLGYVGTVTAACLAANGHDVWGVDVDAAKVGPITEGTARWSSPAWTSWWRTVVAAGRLHATTDPRLALERADVSLICVGTPSTPAGSTDLTYIRRAVGDIAEAAQRRRPPASGFHSVVVRSTVPPGTVDEVVAPVLAEVPAAGRSRLRHGDVPGVPPRGLGRRGLLRPAVRGGRHRGTRRSVPLWPTCSPSSAPTFRLVDVRTAEALKYACNAFHATKVSFANEMARIFRHYGVDAREVMRIFVQDTSLNISPAYLRPGFAFGGSCLPKDLRSLLHLARVNNVDLPLLAGTLATNELSVSDVVDRVVAGPGREVALLGLSFKTTPTTCGRARTSSWPSG